MGELGHAKARDIKHIKHSKYTKYPARQRGHMPPTTAREAAADFTSEEIAFARAMRDAFPLDQEELPPGMLSALLETPQTAPAPAGFEQKMTYLVFRRLRLQRPGLVPPRISLRRRLARISRPVVGMVASLLFLMAFCAILAAPSFASGLRFLLAGQTGVEQVEHYPANVHASPVNQRNDVSATHGDKASVATQDVPTSAYWLGQSTQQLSLDSAWVLPAQAWSQGPVVDVRYAFNVATDGSGLLDIEEFQLANQYASILQVVQDGSAESVDINGAHAVYLRGAWFTNGATHSWGLSNRSELMLTTNDGLVVWMIGDLRDGMDENALKALATQLHPIALRTYLAGLPRNLTPGPGAMVPVSTTENAEVFALFPQGTDLTQNPATSPYYITLPDISTSGQPIFGADTP